MAVAFGGEYTVFVTIFVVALCFCKSVMECVQMGIVIATHCPLEHCTYQCRFDILMYSRLVLLCFSLAQPILMCIGPLLRHLFSGVNPVSHVAIIEAMYQNISSVPEGEIVVQAHAVSIDLQFAAIPFSLAAAVSTAMWLNMSKEGMFSNNPLWDEALFEDENIWQYEIAYYIELVAMCVALVVASSMPQSAAQSWYTSFSLSAILVFFTSTARYNNRSPIGVCMSTVMFSMLCAMLVSVAMSETDTSCAIPVACSITLVMAAAIVAIFHYSAAGQLSSGIVILARTLVSNTCALVLIVTLMLGRSSACG